MHRAAVWQHSSNSNIKIVHNSIEHFLWNPSDFFSDDVLSCLWIVFTNSVFQVPPQKIVRQVEILGIGWPGVISLMWNESVPWEFMPEVFKCSVRELRRHLISRTNHVNTSRVTSHETDSFCIKPITPGHPIPKISTGLTIFWGWYLKDSLWKQSKDKKGNNQKRNHMDSTRNVWNEHSINYWKSIAKHYWFYSGFHQKNSINFQYLWRKSLAGVLIFVNVIAKEK